MTAAATLWCLGTSWTHRCTLRTALGLASTRLSATSPSSRRTRVALRRWTWTGRTGAPGLSAARRVTACTLDTCLARPCAAGTAKVRTHARTHAQTHAHTHKRTNARTYLLEFDVSDGAKVTVEVLQVLLRGLHGQVTDVNFGTRRRTRSAAVAAAAAERRTRLGDVRLGSGWMDRHGWMGTPIGG